MDRFVEMVAEAADGVGALFRARGNSIVDLETSERPARRRKVDHTDEGEGVELGTLVRPDGSLVSLMRVRGAQAVIGQAELPGYSDRVARALLAALRNRGHTVEIMFRRDTETIDNDIEAALAPARRTARRLNMDVDWILDAKRDTLAAWCASEACYIAISTDYRIFSATESKQAAAERERETRKHPIGRYSMNTAEAAASMRASHHALTSNLRRAFAEARISAEPLGAHEALRRIRTEFDPEATSKRWRPLLPGDPLPVRVPMTLNDSDPSSVLYPQLKDQLIPRAPGQIHHNRWIEIGDRIHAPIVMSVPPQHVEIFDRLLAPLIESHTPFRINFRLLPDGIRCISQLRKVIARLSDFLSTTNKQFTQAIETLHARETNGECIVGMQVVADTWVLGDERDLLRNRAEYLAKSLQSWGQCDTRDITGDPLVGVAATIPGLNRVNPAPVSAPPLGEITAMLPLYRPTSPWDAGAVLFRSPDGRLMPYQPGSALQKAWVTLGFAPMGAGKSVLLNAHNFALALRDGLDQLPFISILDIGPSSTGLISLLKHSLPDDRKHLALHRKLRMRPEDAINPFETPMGLRYPLPEHRSMLVDFLVTLATPEGETSPPDGVSGIAQIVVDLVYNALAPENNPKRYDPRMDPELTETVEARGVEIDEHTAWFEIEDALFDLGLTEMAQRAHSYAVPLLSDCAQMAHDNAVTSVYTGVTPTQETMSQYFWRTINEAIGRYPVLSRPTQFNVGSARVVALDLGEVCPKGGTAATKQSGIMYSLARYALTQRYFLDEDAVPAFPKRYQPYYQRLAESLKGEPKLICMDEFHRTGGMGGIRKTVENDIREGRKFGIQVALFSQDANDFDDILVELSSTRFVLGADTPETAAEVARRFGLTDSAADLIYNRITPPGPKGAAMYVSTRTVRGSGEMFCYLTIGPVELWAYNSTAKDRGLRDRLYTRIGVRRTLEALASRFPSGSAVEEIERRQERAGEAVSENGEGVIAELANEVLDAVIAEDRVDGEAAFTG